MARLLEDIEKLPGHIVGHFYMPAKFGHWPDDRKLEQYEDQLIEACSARGMAIEINTTLSVPRKYRAASEDKYRRAEHAADAKSEGKRRRYRDRFRRAQPERSRRRHSTPFSSMLDDADDQRNRLSRRRPSGARRLARDQRTPAKTQKIQEPVQPGSSISGLSRAELGLPEEVQRTPRGVGSGKKRARSGPKKRAGGPARTTKKPVSEEPGAKTSSRRSAESAASSAKAKANAAKAETPAPDSGKESKSKTKVQQSAQRAKRP